MSVTLASTHSQSKPGYQITVLDPKGDLGSLLDSTGPILSSEYTDEDILIEQCQNARQAKKALKKKSSAIILASLDEDSHDEVLQFVSMVRNGMKNRAVRIVACAKDDNGIDEKQLINSHQIDACRDIGTLTSDSLSGLLAAELKTYKQFMHNTARRNAEVNLLTTLAQYSRSELELSDCFREFNNTIGIVSGAELANVLMINDADGINRSDIFYAVSKSNTDKAQEFISNTKIPFNESIYKAMGEGAMQICLADDVEEHSALSKLLNLPIAGSLVFPLKSYNKTLALVQCFLQKEQMDHVSVELIKLVEKSSDQLSVLLERREAERNLQNQYERLKQTLDDLKKTKSQLYQSEKLASVGQLAAGIAHEINNPLTFVMGNFSPLDDYVDSMTELLQLHGQFMQALDHKDDLNMQSLKDSIVSLNEQADMGFVLEDIRSLVADSRDGLVRVKEIIANLKEFSHVDNVDTQMADLHHNIDTTLKMLSHQLKVGIEVVKDYGDIPQVPCNPGLLNQVFMNLLQNAIHAVEDKKGCITIQTAQLGNKVEIKIRDNGYGIPEDKLPDIFNPFFHYQAGR